MTHPQQNPNGQNPYGPGHDPYGQGQNPYGQPGPYDPQAQYGQQAHFGHQPHPGQFSDPRDMYGAPAHYQAQPNAGLLNAAQHAFFTKVFGWMGLGLGVTAFVAWMTATSGFIYTIAPFILPLFLVELGLVWFLSARATRMSSGAAIGTFLAYAALNGLTLSVILLVYAMSTITIAFLSTTVMFGFMFVWGLVTKKDLSGMGSMLFMGLIGLIAASVLNWFFQSPMMSYLISYAGVAIFLGLTMFDAQKLKQLSAQGFQNGEMEQRFAIIGALMLYLDFINLFLFLLRIFGGGRD